MASHTMQPDQVSIGIICPLAVEVAAMLQMLDERYTTQQFPRDSNLYHLGRIGKHCVVIAGLPDGRKGISFAATAAQRLRFTFHSVKTLLLVGIAGGVPTAKNDMRLGDVVISRPDGRYGGVVQYDFGKSLSGGRFEHTGALNSPPLELLVILGVMRAKQLVHGNRPPDYLSYLETSQANQYLMYPGTEKDLLFDANYDHAGGSDCSKCDRDGEIKRRPREVEGPVIHYGTIASANQVMRSSQKRDSCNKDHDGRILCFEMESAGLMNTNPCLVIRGISNYADSHKSEDQVWDGYAAAAAAAVAKEFINTIPGDGSKSVMNVAEDLTKKERVVHIPFQGNTDFAGREDVIKRIEPRMPGHDLDHQLALYGPGDRESKSMLQ